MIARRRRHGRGGAIDHAAHAAGDGGERLGRRRARAVAGHARAHRLGDLLQRQFAHAVHDRVGGRVEDDRSPDGVVPEIVMREPAQRRLDAAGEDSHRPAEDAPDHVAVRDQRAVRPAAADAAGRVVVLAPRPLQRGVIVDHRVHRAGRDGEEQPRLAEPRDVLGDGPACGRAMMPTRNRFASSIRPSQAGAKEEWSTYASPVTKITSSSSQPRSFASSSVMGRKGAEPLQEAQRVPRRSIRPNVHGSMLFGRRGQSMMI